MNALLLKAPYQLELTDIPRPPLLSGQVRVKIKNVGVCGSDYSSIAGELPFTRFPIVPGHEASGEVLEAGGAADWRPGDRVLIHPILADRNDSLFKRGEVHHCLSAEVLGVVSRNGAYAEEVVVEDYMLWRIPDGVNDESAAMAEPLAVAVRALQRGGLRPLEDVLVVGAGNIGILVVQAACALGARRIVAADVRLERLALAGSLGADAGIDVRAGYPAGRLENEFDVVVDGVGTAESVQNAIASLRRGGRLVVYGVPAGEIAFPLKAAFVKDAILATSRLYDTDFTAAVRLIEEAKIRVQDIITHRVTLAAAPSLILRVLDGSESALKVMISL
jgi:L-iditol 2-dehydrogenase